MNLELAIPRRSLGDAARTRLVKGWVRAALAVGADDFITVNELRCAEPGCPEVETVIGILTAGQPARPLRLHKPLAELTAADLTALADVLPET